MCSRDEDPRHVIVTSAIEETVLSEDGEEVTPSPEEGEEEEEATLYSSALHILGATVHDAGHYHCIFYDADSTILDRKAVVLKIYSMFINYPYNCYIDVGS